MEKLGVNLIASVIFKNEEVFLFNLFFVKSWTERLCSATGVCVHVSICTFLPYVHTFGDCKFFNIITRHSVVVVFIFWAAVPGLTFQRQYFWTFFFRLNPKKGFNCKRGMRHDHSWIISSLWWLQHTPLTLHAKTEFWPQATTQAMADLSNQISLIKY